MTISYRKSARGTQQPAVPNIARRMAALTYDLILVLAILLLGTIPWVIARGGDGDTLNYESLGIAYQLYCALLIAGYFVVSWQLKGATLGMKSWRLHLVSERDTPLTLAQLCTRAAVAPFAWAPMAIGVVWQHINEDGLTWHDIASQTRVVITAKTNA